MYIEGYTLLSHRYWVTTDGKVSFERVAPSQYRVSDRGLGQSVLQAVGLDDVVCHGTLDEVIEQVASATSHAIADTIEIENDYEIVGEPVTVSYCHNAYWTVIPNSDCSRELSAYLINLLGWTHFKTRRELLQAFVRTMKQYPAYLDAQQDESRSIPTYDSRLSGISSFESNK